MRSSVPSKTTDNGPLSAAALEPTARYIHLYRTWQLAQRPIEPRQGLLGVFGSHCCAKAVVARRAAVVVKIDAVLGGQLVEPQQQLAVVPLSLGIILHRMIRRNAKVDSESCAEPLHAGDNVVFGQERSQAA